ncbi:PREDICTED: non-classical arabinogalactan protein 31-like [Tarenaya hassleriana]|uniref:non-classical arabinogalactan protein 31-like n=1 Tax=Tarenaya hassleriana TaxID=28532 RepID=UPI00053C9EA3|nr:PREDICTED: non-classical arabinogalactan protein 31-like [Tarenaya hassleriana]
MGFFGKSVLVSVVALWCFTSVVFTEEVNHVSQAPAVAPSPHSHHKHHHPKPPAHPPVPHPAYPPAKPPVKPPTKPPVHPPVKPPTKPPVHPPVKPPAHPPVLPPVYPPKFNRSYVAVQGMVYCKDCKYAGVETLLGAKPVKGAVVRFMCKGKTGSVKEAITDEKGYFFLLAPKTVNNYGFRGCMVKLVKSANPKCSKPSKLHGGDVGGVLTPVKDKSKRIIVVNNLKYGLFDVGPFAFEPSCPR